MSYLPNALSPAPHIFINAFIIAFVHCRTVLHRVSNCGKLTSFTFIRGQIFLCRAPVPLQDVYNPPNAVPLILERTDYPSADATWVHTKAMYRLSDDSRRVLRGVTQDMCGTSPLPPGASWRAGSFAGDPSVQATADSAAEQWAELGGGW